MNNKINHLLEISKKVLQDSSLENGAIVAANTDNNYYPKNVVDYRYVWPRDAAFTIYSANLLGLYDIQKSFIKWLLERAEGFSEMGILYQRYATNGARAQRMGDQYQPDQAGALLWALTENDNKTGKDYRKTVQLLADGLCKNWRGTHFDIQTHDLWEETSILPNKDNNLTYSLAASAYGLRNAYVILEEKKWLRASKEMVASIKNTRLDYYPKIIDKAVDTGIDASGIGLVWPFQSFEIDEKLLNSLKLVEKKLLTQEGVHRYVGDEYDGMLEHMEFVDEGAGGWPLLTFWYIIGLSKIGREKEADELFKKYINNFKDYIPEQVFDNKDQISVSPLVWSHAMFVIACKELGYLNSIK
ncbi:hypothetical protein COY62_03485 [bacterium (Candidatus Howlettbacteria) CG_4_10_14_0_8_um_filter_40_9]|nr:MAG: hypothetical protein COY62_03485 [bacterium (Candidatus Howlettbacteria) CG_4_10_14_0_8_um_filter_40_9]